MVCSGEKTADLVSLSSPSDGQTETDGMAQPQVRVRRDRLTTIGWLRCGTDRQTDRLETDGQIRGRRADRQTDV